MKIIDATQIPMQQEDWARQLADLTRLAWSGRDGRCHFPYRPLTEAHEWEHAVRSAWIAETMFSWILIDSHGHFLAHAALVKKPNHWELGRWVALPTAPKGAITLLCKEALRHAANHRMRVQVECTQAHTASQHICTRLGLRFAGIGILGKVEGITWDIIYFDSLDTPSFVPRTGMLGDPLHQPMRCEETHRARLRELPDIITTDRGGELPPMRFHLLPELIEPVRSIIRLNT